NPMFLLGFLISPAINVTPVQASLEKIEPTIAAEIPDNKAVPPIEVQVMVSRLNERDPQTFAQLAFHTSAFAPSRKPNTTRPKRESIFIMVRKVWSTFPFFTPLLFI